MPEIRKAMHAKRMKKLTKVLEELEPPNLLGDGERYVVVWDYAPSRLCG